MKNSVSKFSLIFFVLLAATGTLAQPVSQGKAAVPSAGDQASVELEFWKSVERMDTADAYAAYLEAYPTGRFALLARLAMKKQAAGAAQPAAVAAPAAPTAPPAVVRAPAAVVPATQTVAPLGGGQLNAWSEPASGAINLDAGHRIKGPGVITVGRLGARKQVPIPEGEWMVVAATDHDSDTQPRYGANGGMVGQGAVKLTTLTLAQFEGTAARSLLMVTFNRVTNDMPRFIWKGAEQCVASEEQFEYRHTEGGGRKLKLCVQLRHDPNSGVRAAFEPVHRREINQNLGKLGGRLGTYNTETDLYLVDQYAAYLRITRLDCTQAQQDRPACGLPGIQATDLATQVTWAKAYAQQAYTGFDRNLALPELTAQVAPNSAK